MGSGRETAHGGQLDTLGQLNTQPRRRDTNGESTQLTRLTGQLGNLLRGGLGLEQRVIDHRCQFGSGGHDMFSLVR